MEDTGEAVEGGEPLGVSGVSGEWEGGCESGGLGGCHHLGSGTQMIQTVKGGLGNVEYPSLQNCAHASAHCCRWGGGVEMAGGRWQEVEGTHLLAGCRAMFIGDGVEVRVAEANGTPGGVEYEWEVR